MSEEDDRYFPGFEKMGETEVRFMTNQWSGNQRGAALRWLEKRRQADRLARDASSREQIELTRQANQIATHAKNAAIAALVVAIIAAIAAIFGDFR